MQSLTNRWLLSGNVTIGVKNRESSRHLLAWKSSLFCKFLSGYFNHMQVLFCSIVSNLYAPSVSTG